MRAALAALLIVASASTALGESRTHAESGVSYELLPAPTWNATDPRPLLVCLHGSGDKAGNFVRYLQATVPEVSSYHRAYLQSPRAEGWASAELPAIVAIAKELRVELRTQTVFLVGFSAGGGLAAHAMVKHADVFDGALISAALGPAPAELETPPLVWWSLGATDDHFGAQEGIDRHSARVRAAGWPESRAQIDVIPDFGHLLHRDSLTRGLRWLVEQTEAVDPEPELLEVVAGVPALLEAGDPTALTAALDPVLATRSAALRAAVFDALVSALDDRRADVAAAVVALVGRTRDPRAAKPLRSLLRKRTTKKNPELMGRVVLALGSVPSTESVKGLSELVKKTKLATGLRLAAVRQLAGLGDDAVDALLGLQSWAERKRETKLSQACDASLQTLTGLDDFDGSLEWKAYRKRFR